MYGDTPELMNRQQSKEQLITAFIKSGRNGIAGDVISYGGVLFVKEASSYLPIMIRVDCTLYLYNSHSLNINKGVPNPKKIIDDNKIPYCDAYQIFMTGIEPPLRMPTISMGELEDLLTYLDSNTSNIDYNNLHAGSINDGRLQIPGDVGDIPALLTARNSRKYHQYMALKRYYNTLQAADTMKLAEGFMAMSDTLSNEELRNRGLHTEYLNLLVECRENLHGMLDKVDSMIELCVRIPVNEGDSQ